LPRTHQGSKSIASSEKSPLFCFIRCKISFRVTFHILQFYLLHKLPVTIHHQLWFLLHGILGTTEVKLFFFLGLKTHHLQYLLSYDILELIWFGEAFCFSQYFDGYLLSNCCLVFCPP
jgi:hypothetical protein